MSRFASNGVLLRARNAQRTISQKVSDSGIQMGMTVPCTNVMVQIFTPPSHNVHLLNTVRTTVLDQYLTMRAAHTWRTIQASLSCGKCYWYHIHVEWCTVPVPVVPAVWELCRCPACLYGGNTKNSLYCTTLYYLLCVHPLPLPLSKPPFILLYTCSLTS
jgi:hypothetical protein